MTDRLDLRANAGGAERSGVRLSRIKGGERTWQLALVDAGDAPALRAMALELVELDLELERAYTGERPAPRIHPPPRPDDDEEF